MRDEERGVQARDLDLYTVDGADAHPPAAQALAAHLRRGALLVFKVDINGIGVYGGVIATDVEGVGEAAFICHGERIADSLVIGVEPQDTAHECTVGSVSTVGVSEAVPEGEPHRGDASLQQARGNLRAPQGACRV